MLVLLEVIDLGQSSGQEGSGQGVYTHVRRGDTSLALRCESVFVRTPLPVQES